jgi:hypothetical protein
MDRCGLPAQLVPERPHPSGDGDRRPETIVRVVVLPAQLDPSTPNASPSAMPRERWSTSINRPNRSVSLESLQAFLHRSPLPIVN